MLGTDSERQSSGLLGTLPAERLGSDYPDRSHLEAMRYFYEELGDRLWGEYGFKDAFNLTENWFASSYLAIDQGPIIVMIENYRSGLIWKLFMSHPDVQRGLKRLGFGSEE